MNGDFESFSAGTFTGWTSPDEPIPAAMGFPAFVIPYADAVLGTDADGNFAILQDVTGSGDIGTRLFQKFTLPESVTSLSFEFQVVSPDSTGPGGVLLPSQMPDVFGATLLSDFDVAGDPQGSIGSVAGTFGGPVFYEISGGPPTSSSLVDDSQLASRTGWTKVELDLSGLPFPRTQEVALQLTLDDELSAFTGNVDVYVDNIRLQAVVPEPSTLLAWSAILAISCVSPRRRRC